jgi:hypothetical protein
VARIKKAASADLVWNILSVHVGGMSARMICHHTGLSDSQFRGALDYIRDLFQEDREQPIITSYVGGEYLYVLTEDPVQRRAYAIRRKRAQLKAAKRDEKNAHAAHLKWPGDTRVESEALRCRLHRAELEVALADLEAA